MKSGRKEIAEAIAAFIRENDLAQVFGGDVDLANNFSRPGKHYSVLLSRRSTLDGVVRVFSPARIHVMTKGPLGFGSTTFTSGEQAIEFLRLAFVEFDRAAAHKFINKK